MADDDDSKPEKSKTSKALTGAAKGYSAAAQPPPERVSTERDSGSGPVKVQMDSYRKGGKVRKTGKARLHKGEVVVGKRSKKARKGGRE